MKTQHQKSLRIVGIVILLLMAFISQINAQQPKTTSKNTDKQKVVVLNGKIMPMDYDVSTINDKFIESVNVIKPDPGNLADFISQFGNNAKYGIIIIKTKRLNKADSIKLAEEPERIYQVIEQMPQFPGGESKLLNFINKNLIYPEQSLKEKVQGVVIVRFVVNSKGKVERTEVLRSLNSECDKESVRVINSLPDFFPGKQNGINVSVWYTMPIRFRL